MLRWSRRSSGANFYYAEQIGDILFSAEIVKDFLLVPRSNAFSNTQRSRFVVPVEVMQQKPQGDVCNAYWSWFFVPEVAEGNLGRSQRSCWDVQKPAFCLRVAHVPTLEASTATCLFRVQCAGTGPNEVHSDVHSVKNRCFVKCHVKTTSATWRVGSKVAHSSGETQFFFLCTLEARYG